MTVDIIPMPNKIEYYGGESTLRNYRLSTKPMLPWATRTTYSTFQKQKSQSFQRVKKADTMLK